MNENGSEIRSQKRAYKVNEGIESDNKLLDLPGIVDPNTGKILTVGEAIKLHLLDVRTGEVILISGERMSLVKAAEQRLINPELAIKLSNHLEATQHELTEAENGPDTAEKRIKVTTTSTTTVSSQVKTIADAIKDETVDPILGVYKLPDGSTITITDAYQRGLLIKNETVKIKSTPLCLADAISHGLVDQAGWVVDRNAGDKFRLDSAIANDLILPNFQEIVDTRNDVKVTVTKAIEMGLLNAKTGRYINPLTKEKLTFIEAKNRQLIVRPMTLKDVCDSSLMDKEGLITSPTRKSQLTVLEAINVGILDGDEIHSISKGDDGDLLTLNDAIGQGIVGVNNKFKNLATGETMTVQEAVNEGLISSVTQKSIFDIDGFKNPHSGDFVSLNDALAKDILVKTNDGFKMDSGKNKLVTLSEGIGMNLVRKEVNEMLNRRVGVFDENDHEISVLDLVLYDLIDPKSGYLLDYNKQTIVPLNHAIDRKMITPEGALLLSSLLNITLTTETVSKIEKRYITIANTQIGEYSQEGKASEDNGLCLADAIEQNVFDASTGVFTIPNTDRLVSFEECIQLGLINSESMKIVDPKYKEEISVHRAFEKNILDTTGHYRSHDGWMPMDKSIEKGVIILKPADDDKTYTSTSRLELSRSPRRTPSKTPETEAMSPEPLEISPGVIYDPSTALIINMKTGKSENLLQAVKDNLVDPELVHVIDHSSGKPISIDDAIKKGILSPQSGEIVDATGRKVSIIDAVKTGLLIVAGAPLVAAAGAINSLKMVFDPSTNQHIPVELAYERGLVSRDEISDFTLSDSIPRSSVISQASSFDIPTPKDMAQTPSKSRRHSGLYDDEISESDFKPTPFPRKSLTESIPNKTFTEDINVAEISTKNDKPTRHPSEGRDTVDKSLEKAPLEELSSQVSVNEALQRGLLDLKTGLYTDPSTNQVIPIQEAVNKGLLVSASNNIEEEILNISPVHEKSTSSDVPLKAKDISKDKNEPNVEKLSEKVLNEIDKAQKEIEDKIELEKKIDSKLSQEVFPRHETENFENIKHLETKVSGSPPGEAKDLTQESISNILEIDNFRKSPEKVISEIVEVSSSTSEVKDSKQKEKSLSTKPEDSKATPVSVEDQEPKEFVKLVSQAPKESQKSEELEKDSQPKEIPTDELQSISKDSNSKEKPKNSQPSDESLSVCDDSKSVEISKTETKPVDNLSLKSEDLVKNSFEDSHQPKDILEGELQSSDKPISGDSQIKEIEQKSSEISQVPLNEQKSVEKHIEHENKSKKPEDKQKIAQQELIQIAQDVAPDDIQFQSQSQPSSESENSKSQIKGSDIANAAKLGLMAIVGAPVLAGMAVADSVKNLMNKSSDEPESHQATSQKTFTKPPSGQDKMVFSTIQEMSESVISDVFKPEPETSVLQIDDNITPEELEKIGAFDKRTGAFIDPSTGSKVSFDDFIYNCGVFNPELIYVKDFSNDNYVPLAVALEKVLIDRHTGIMVEPKTGKRIPFFECLKRQWIIQKEPPKTQTLSLQEAREANLINEDNGKVAVDGILLPLNEALNSGIIEIDTISIRDASGEVMPLSQAIESGVVDLKRGVIIDPKTGETKPLDSALRDGNLLEGN